MGRRAVVTGASGGIGSAIARRLAEDGFVVIAGYLRSKDSADELIDTLPGEGHRAMRISVLEDASLAELVEYVRSTGGSVEALVNCAGVTEPVPHDDLDGLHNDLIDVIFQTNWRGPFAVTRALRPALLADDGAVVVNISSISGTTGQGSNVAYCASKAALDSMTRSLGRALAPSIRVVSVAPGWVMGDYADRMSPEMLQTQRDATPLGRLAAPADVAAAVSACISDLHFTTGAIIPVDGGRPLGSS